MARNVVLVPAPNPKNPYIALISKSLEMGGCTVGSIDDAMGPLSAWHEAPVILNWFEEISATPRAALRLFREKNDVLDKLRANGASLVYVVHNKRPHDSYGGLDRVLSRRLRRRLCRQASKIVILSSKTSDVLKEQLGALVYARIAEKIEHIPHPSYLGAYPESGYDYREKFDIPNDSFLFVFTGAIRPYKNVELVIDAARRMHDDCPNARFLIAGRCNDESYLAALKDRASGIDSLKIDPQYVPNEKMTALINAADALLLPYDIKSSLNSGTAMLAFTYRKNVVSPINGTIRDLPVSTFGYKYQKTADHLDALINAAKSAYKTWETDNDAYEAMADALGAYANGECSLERIAMRYSEVLYGKH